MRIPVGVNMGSRDARGKKDYQTLRAELLSAQKLFVDQDFPPNDWSLTKNGTTPANQSRVVWKRPSEISRNPRYVTGGTKRFDLNQGELGNCWFVAAAASVSLQPKLFKRVVPVDQGFAQGYAGIFRFYFWWYGRWEEIVVDDYLPTNGRYLIYTRNREDPDEYWAPLLEKAYAKLRGNYETIDGGKISDALVDMTGGITETIDLRQSTQLPADLYTILWKSYQMNSLLGGAIYLPDNGPRSFREVELTNGLYQGHAYSITGMATVPHFGTNAKLLRVRNPWGKGEWNRAWSDSSPEMRSLSTETKRQLNIVTRDEGEFWISYQDFVSNFDEIQICHLQPDALTQEIALDDKKQQWNVTVYHDAWIRGVTAGGCGNSPNENLFWKNPQFFVTLVDIDVTSTTNLCTLIVSLTEKEEGGAQDKHAIGFTIFKLKDNYRKPLDGRAASRQALIRKESSGKYQFNREVTCRYDLDPGTYVIIPAAFSPHEEAEFMLRIYTEKKITSGVLDEDPEPTTPATPPTDTTMELFTKYAGINQKMDSRELRMFLRAISTLEINEQMDFSKEACRSLLTMVDKNKSGFVDLDEAKHVWKEVKAYRTVFQQFDKDKGGSIDTYELGSMFNALGFPVSRNVLTSIVRRYGGRDNKIDLEDFIVVICKLILMYDVFRKHQTSTGGEDNVAEFTRNEWLQYTMYC